MIPSHENWGLSQRIGGAAKLDQKSMVTRDGRQFGCDGSLSPCGAAVETFAISVESVSSVFLEGLLAVLKRLEILQAQKNELLA